MEKMSSFWHLIEIIEGFLQAHFETTGQTFLWVSFCSWNTDSWFIRDTSNSAQNENKMIFFSQNKLIPPPA